MSQDQLPNGEGCHIDLTTKASLYARYERDMWMQYYPNHCMDPLSSRYRTFDDLEVVSFQVWKSIWRFSFPHCKVRKFKQVTGKCWTCYAINAGRSKANTRSKLIMYKKLFTMHRGGLFMLERRQYKKRAEFARRPENRDKVLSFIVDGMDQSHSRIPRTGSSLDYPHEQLTQHLTGLLEHGGDLYIHRTFDNLSKGANLTVHCILLAIERFLDNHGKFPEEMYVQLDGGSENANRVVLGFLELLIARLIVKKIIFTRLPVGHTHEDIDACFG